jgi:hypothetical protein
MATPSWPKAIETNETELRPLSETQVPQPFTPVLQDLFGERFSAHISVPGCGSLSARQSCNVLPRCGPIAAEGNWRQYTFVAGHGLPGPARSDRFFREQDAKDSHCATQGEGRACGKARRSGKGKGGGVDELAPSPWARLALPNQRPAGADAQHPVRLLQFASAACSLVRGERTRKADYRTRWHSAACGTHWRARRKSGEPFPSSAGRGTGIESSVAAQ